MDLENSLNERLINAVKNNIIPGMNYGIISNEEIIGSIGYKKLFPDKEEISIDTLYDIASLTKVVVTVPLICKLIDEKKLSFMDNVKTYLNNFKYDDVTIYHLLTHTSGLPADLNSKEIISKKELLDKTYGMEKIYETGKEVIYSDLGYILLGEIIEKIYNKSLDVVAKEELFIPLEMHSTTYNPTNKEKCAPTEFTQERGLIQGIVHDEKACSLGGVAGHAGVFSTVKDLMNFVKMILNDGVYNNKQILSKNMIDLWFKDIVFEIINERTRSLCWITGVNDLVINEGLNIISFNGFTGPSISIDRDKKLGIVLMTNRIHPTRDNRKIPTERPLITNCIYNCLAKNKEKH